jgi:hypothetical protein
VRGGVAAFVTVAALSAQDAPISDHHLVTILILLGIILALLGAGFALWHRRWNAIAYTVGAGVQFGFVAALAKTVIARILQGDFEWLSLTCLAGLGPRPASAPTSSRTPTRGGVRNSSSPG